MCVFKTNHVSDPVQYCSRRESRKILTLLYLLHRWKWNGKHRHSHIASARLREWSYCSAQEDPRRRLRRYFQRRVGQTKAQTAKPRNRGKERESECDANEYSAYVTQEMLLKLNSIEKHYNMSVLLIYICDIKCQQHW